MLLVNVVRRFFGCENLGSLRSIFLDESKWAAHIESLAMRTDHDYRPADQLFGLEK